jgi:cyclopropane fatty-acyl-phospholipid synthase-like methyltransferase
MKRHAPATSRNAGPIAEVLARELPASGLVLEVASGTGEHAVFMARRFLALEWQPSDLDTEALASIDAYAAEAGLANLLPALEFDAAIGNPPVAHADALVCINMVHISPWEASVGLFRAAARLLEERAPLVLYGPFIEDDIETAASNWEFDRSLKTRNPAWGLRKLVDLDGLARQWGFDRTSRVEMPVNNLAVTYRRGGAEG